MTLDLDIKPHLLSSILARFRHAKRSDVQHRLDNRAAILGYLARTHDLTTSEAGDTLDDCLTARDTTIAKAA
ncbi:MAG: hypothetical protein ACSHWY_08490 [Octadecabacter sp.]